MLYEFPEYLPDLPAYNNPGMVDAENVIPAGNSYQQAQGLVDIYGAIDAYARGGFNASEPDGENAAFVGNETKLYRLVGNTITDVTRTLSAYATASEDLWDFTQFGNHVIATNFTDEMQTVDLSAAATTKFVDLSGSAVPKAKYITTVKDFVMVGNLPDNPFRVQWSGIGDHTKWPTGGSDPVSQAGFQDLDSQYGPIRGIVGGEYAIVFQERAITRLEYVGSPIVFSFSTQETNQGTRYPKSIIRMGDSIYYLGIDGFFRFDGHRSVSIGENKVDRTVMRALDEARPDRVSSAIDYDKHVIGWAIPTGTSPNVSPDQIWYYNYSRNSKNRWAVVKQQVDMLFTTRSPGYTMDNIGTYLTDQGLSDNMELLPAPLDSAFWMGGSFEFSGFFPDGTNSRWGLFSGDALPAKLETAEAQINKGQRTELQLVKPIVTNNHNTNAAEMVVTMKIGSRNQISDQVTFGGTLQVDDIGQVPCHVNARYHRLQVQITGSFADAIGVEVLEQVPGGYR